MRILNRRRKAVNGAKILMLGVAYKNDIDDYWEPLAIRVMKKLRKVGYYGSWVPGKGYK